jgi:demethylmenaquinone methyltransferase/2-methoxy-6-polyprenyl-1,4-benzoquinol methylase
MSARHEPSESSQELGTLKFVRELFDDTADEYERLNQVLSLGSGGWYRRDMLRRAGLQPGMRVLDVATGTGSVAREALSMIGGSTVIGLDVSRGMLAAARRSLDLPLVQACAERLPIASGSIDLVTMGYALRHVPDMLPLFDEFWRVLRPGGTVLLLEISRPESRLGQAMVHLYLSRIVPLLAGTSGGRGQDLMRYYWDTIASCVSPATILESLRVCGFVDATCGTSLGILRAYEGRKSVADLARASSLAGDPGCAADPTTAGDTPLARY